MQFFALKDRDDKKVLVSIANVAHIQEVDADTSVLTLQKPVPVSPNDSDGRGLQDKFYIAANKQLGGSPAESLAWELESFNDPRQLFDLRPRVRNAPSF